MKLVLKLPKEKPPFIGVLLAETHNQAYPERLNEDLINEHKYADYRLALEFEDNLLNLALLAEGSGIARYYKALEFEAPALASWIYVTRQARQFNFGHVRLERGRETIVKTWGKKLNFVLTIQSYSVKAPF